VSFTKLTPPTVVIPDLIGDPATTEHRTFGLT